MKHPERIAQQKLVAHLNEFYPDLLFWHTPNGEKREKKIAAELKRMGTRPGVPDLFFPTLRVFIEMKAPNETTSIEQDNVSHLLRLAGYEVHVYDDWRAAFALIEERMRGRGLFGFTGALG